MSVLAHLVSLALVLYTGWAICMAVMWKQWPDRLRAVLGAIVTVVFFYFGRP